MNSLPWRAFDFCVLWDLCVDRRSYVVLPSVVSVYVVSGFSRTVLAHLKADLSIGLRVVVVAFRYRREASQSLTGFVCFSRISMQLLTCSIDRFTPPANPLRSVGLEECPDVVACGGVAERRQRFGERGAAVEEPQPRFERGPVGLDERPRARPGDGIVEEGCEVPRRVL